MKKLSIQIIALLVVSLQVCQSFITQDIDLNRGFIKSSSTLAYERQPIPEDLPISSLPDQWLWSDINGKNYLTLVMSQHSPNYCGSSWALSATSAISDRIKIMRDAAWPEINLAPQVLLSCDYKDQGCLGGDDLTAYEYMCRYNITDQTCSIYQGKGYEGGLQCSKETICGDCNVADGCWAVEDYNTYTLVQFGSLKGEKDMMNEIKQRGPISCSIANTPELQMYTGGIFEDTSGNTDLNLVVSVVGWGVENNQPYWMVRNTVGAYWGENGYFRIVRGVNNLGIEERCNYGIPADTWSEKEKLMKQNKKLLLAPKKFKNFLKQQEPSEIVIDESKPRPELIKSPLPHTYMNEDDLPKNWDWRNVDGVNYQSWSVNQHIPVYCGSCWSQGTSSSIADRINILRKNKFPNPALAVQTILNCKWGGSCGGGDSIQVYENANKYGIPVMNCQQYVARNPSVFECSEIQKCQNCYPSKSGGEICVPVSTFNYYKKYFVSEYGTIEKNNKHAIKAEIKARGPVSCSMYSTPTFHQYKGGIYSEKISETGTNHVIQLLGWGVEDGQEYWIGRNSWGTYWGEQGYFRIVMDTEYNLNIEVNCNWGVPIIEESQQEEEQENEIEQISI